MSEIDIENVIKFAQDAVISESLVIESVQEDIIKAITSVAERIPDKGKTACEKQIPDKGKQLSEKQIPDKGASLNSIASMSIITTKESGPVLRKITEEDIQTEMAKNFGEVSEFPGRREILFTSESYGDGWLSHRLNKRFHS